MHVCCIGAQKAAIWAALVVLSVSSAAMAQMVSQGRPLPVANGGTGITAFGTGVATFLGSAGSGFAVDSSGNVTGTAYKMGANTFVTSDGTYNYFASTNAVNVILLGGAADPTNYYDRATHKFRGPGGTGAPHLHISQTTAPALTSCGTGSPTNTGGSDTAGTVVTGTNATGCVITFNVAYTGTPNCVVSWQSTPAASQSYTISTSAITLTQTSASGRVVNYVCAGT